MLASNYRASNRFAEAEPLILDAIDFFLKAEDYDPYHRSNRLAYAYNDLGNLYQVQGRTADAEAQYRAAQNIFEDIHGGKQFPRRSGRTGTRELPEKQAEV